MIGLGSDKNTITNACSGDGSGAALPSVSLSTPSASEGFKNNIVSSSISGYFDKHRKLVINDEVNQIKNENMLKALPPTIPATNVEGTRGRRRESGERR